MGQYVYKIFKCAKGETKGREIGMATTEEAVKVQLLRFQRLYPQNDFIFRRVEEKPCVIEKQSWIGPHRAA